MGKSLFRTLGDLKSHGKARTSLKVNLSAPRPEYRSLPLGLSSGRRLKVHPEPRLFTMPLKTRLRAVERVNSRRRQERLYFSIRRFTPAFAEAATRRQAEAFPRQRIIFVMTGMSLKGSTGRLIYARLDRFLAISGLTQVSVSFEANFRLARGCRNLTFFSQLI